MSKKQFVKRYILIINRLRRRPCSFEQLAAYLRTESELDGENYEISLRTFQRDIRDIATIYNIEIEFNKSMGLYEIAEETNDPRTERIMESFEVFNALNLTGKFASHLIVEKRKPLGTEHMYGLLHAIRNRSFVRFNHEKYWEADQQHTTRKVAPIALKEARHRWYLVARDSRDSLVKSFGLERISNLEILNEKVLGVGTLDVEAHFRDCFGIICEDDIKAEDILLMFTPSEAKYIKSLPLHHSQRVISETDSGTIFALHLYPSYDLMMELLSFGNQVQVLEPVTLREQVREKLREALDQYR